MVSWMAASASLRYFAFIADLRKITPAQESFQRRITQVQNDSRGFLVGFLFTCVEICLAALRKTIDEEGPLPTQEQNDASIAFCPSRSGSGQSLLDDTPTQISINLTSLRPSDSLAQDLIADPLFPREPFKPS
jgi:hypothetical protein